VHEFSFRDRTGHPQVSTLPLDDAEMVLKSPAIRTFRVRADRDGEIVDT